MTRAELHAAVLSYVKRDDKTTEINTSLNLQLKELCKRKVFREMVKRGSDIAIAEDDAYVSVPSNTWAVRSARLINGSIPSVITIKSPTWLEQRWPSVADLTSGIPRYGWHDKENDRFYLYPVSNGSYDLRLVTVELPEDFAGDTTEIPVEGLDVALIHMVTSDIFVQVKLWREAEAHKILGERALANAVGADAFEPPERQHAGAGPLALRSTSEKQTDPWYKGN